MTFQKILSFSLSLLFGSLLSCSCQSKQRTSSLSELDGDRSFAEQGILQEIDLNQSFDGTSLSSLKHFLNNELASYEDLKENEIYRPHKVQDVTFYESLFFGRDLRQYKTQKGLFKHQKMKMGNGSIFGSIWGDECEPTDIMDIEMNSHGFHFPDYELPESLDCINPMQRVQVAHAKILLYVQSLAAVAQAKAGQEVSFLKKQNITFSPNQKQINGAKTLIHSLSQVVCSYGQTGPSDCS